MITALSMEFYKIRHRKVGLTVAMMIGVQFLWALWAMNKMSEHELSQGWMSSIYSFSQLNCIMMPILVAIVASRLSDIEHKGATIKLLKTLMPSNRLFTAKFLCGAVFMVITVILQTAIILFIGYTQGITQQFPLGYFSYFIFFTLLVDLTLLVLQLILSLLFLNQMVGFIIAIAGAFLGLYSLFFSNVGNFVLWGYYVILSPVRMNWDRASRIVDYYWSTIPLVQLTILIITFILFHILGQKLFTEKEA
jgi:hypothetical protein